MSLVRNKLLSYQSGLVTIEGSFATNAGSSPLSASNRGTGWSVVRTSQGVWTVTIDTRYQQIVNVNATVQLASAAARFIQVGAITATASGTTTIVLRTVDASAAVQDIAADTNNRINFTVVAKWTNV